MGRNTGRQYILTVGDDSRPINNDEKNPFAESIAKPSAYYVLKVYTTLETSRPLQSFPISTMISPTAIMTSMAVLHDGSQIAIGFSTGAVLFFSGNFFKEGNLGRQQHPQVLLQSHASPVSGLHFCELISSKPNDRRIHLYAVLDTEQYEDKTKSSFIPGSDDPSQAGGIIVFDTSVVMTAAGTIVPAQRKPPHILDERGAAVGCSSLMKDTCELVIGRLEGVFSYSVDDRGGAAAFEGEKQCISAVGRHILVGGIDEKTRRSSITIYDLRNKFISMNSSLSPSDKVSLVLHDGGTAYIITSSWSLIRFREKDTASKLDVLMRKSLYPLAISLAAEEQSDLSEIMKIYKMYGDHLYKKNEFDSAITQYCYTIGYVQPSYVVRKFLDPNRIPNLITYLEKLVERGLGSKDHITLLLTCYTKLKDDLKISEFCKNSSKLVSSNNDDNSSTKLHSDGSFMIPSRIMTNSNTHIKKDTDFDIESAIKILDKEGFTKYALELAVKHRLDHEYLTIQTRSSSNSKTANIESAISYFTSLIFTSNTKADTLLNLLSTHGRTMLFGAPEQMTIVLIKLCSGDFESLRPTTITSSVSKDLYPLAIDDVMEIFVDQDKHLRVLIEGVYEDPKAGMMSPKVSGTLLEIYLQEYFSLKQSGSNTTSIEEKIMFLLDGFNADYDSSQALLLTHAYEFETGEKFLLEKMQCTELLLRMNIESGDEKGIFKILRKEGRKDPDLYVRVLSYLVEQSISTTDNDDKWDSIIEVLGLIEKENILSPMNIITILGKNPELPLFVASKYLKQAINLTEDDIGQLEEDVAAMKNTVESLSLEDSAQRQLVRGKVRETRRSTNVNPYDDDDEEDDGILEEHEAIIEKRKWDAIKKAQIERGDDNEGFFAELEGSQDGFATIAAFFGKATIV